MKRLCSLPGHVFWADDVSLLDERLLNINRLLTSSQVTDSYLLALAYAHGGQLATFDRRLVTDSIYHGKQSLHLIKSENGEN